MSSRNNNHSSLNHKPQSQHQSHQNQHEQPHIQQQNQAHSQQQQQQQQQQPHSHRRQHSSAHSASLGQLSLDIPFSGSSFNNTSSFSSRSPTASSPFDNNSSPLESSRLCDSAASTNASPSRSGSYLYSPIKSDNYTTASARLRRPSVGSSGPLAASTSATPGASASATSAATATPTTIPSAAATNATTATSTTAPGSSLGKSEGTIFTNRLSPRNSFSHSPYMSSNSASNNSSQIIVDKPSYTPTPRLSSGEIIDVMEKEQDAIVVKLMREINSLKEENKFLRAQMNNPNYDASAFKSTATSRSRSRSSTASSSRRYSTVLLDEPDYAKVARRRRSSQRFSDSITSGFDNYKFDSSFGSQDLKPLTQINLQSTEKPNSGSDSVTFGDKKGVEILQQSSKGGFDY